jgi:hypothetical protein
MVLEKQPERLHLENYDGNSLDRIRASGEQTGTGHETVDYHKGLEKRIDILDAYLLACLDAVKHCVWGLEMQLAAYHFLEFLVEIVIPRHILLGSRGAFVGH